MQIRIRHDVVDQAGLVYQVEAAALRPEAVREAWTFVGEQGLRLPPCARGCGLSGVCFTCGVAVHLMSDILYDSQIDLMAHDKYWLQQYK